MKKPQETSDLVYGRWPVRESLDAGGVAKILLAFGSHGDPIDDILAVAKQKQIPFHFVERKKLDTMVGGQHQGIVAYVRTKPLSSFDDLLESALHHKSRVPALIFLDSVTDPQNVGSILRSAFFFGVRGVVIPKWRAATVTPAVVRASAGAAHLISIAQVSNLAQAMDTARKKGLWLVGADMAGEDVKRADIPRPFALVLGSEGEGLHDLIRKKCDYMVRITRLADGTGIDSLNVGAACAIMLHQFS